MIIRAATIAEHNRLCQISKTHRAGNGFTNILMFSGPMHYEKGWLRVAASGYQIMGFTCVRHKVREPVTKLYYIIVDPANTRHGVGQALLNDLIETSPHRTIHLDCLKDNAPALAFYEKNGFKIIGEALKGTCHKLAKTW